METINLLLVDDHPVVRDGLRRVQEIEPRIKVVGEAADMLGAVQAAQELAPAIILMDVRLPDGNGIEACRRIKELVSSVRILFLTSYADNQFVLAAMEAGADGYLLKENDSARIVDAIRKVMGGGTVFDPIESDETNAAGANPLLVLTPQERRILAEVAKGKTDKEAASTLGLSPKTARNYLDRIFSKLGVRTRTEAALLYTRFGEREQGWV